MTGSQRITHCANRPLATRRPPVIWRPKELFASVIGRFFLHRRRVDADNLCAILTLWIPHLPMKHQTPVILIVEDEPFIRSTLSQYLRVAGFSVVDVANAQDAIDVFDSKAAVVDLVLTDINMPGVMDGRALSNWLLAARPGMPVILTSGVVTPSIESSERGRRFIPKPYELEDVEMQIRELLH